MAFEKGVSGNPNGRPPKDPTKIKTNRERREDTLLALVRKFSPHVSKAVLTASRMLDNENASDMNKLKASSLILVTYKDLVKDLYNKDYDSEEGEAIQESSGPTFSLKMIDFDKERTGTEG